MMADYASLIRPTGLKTIDSDILALIKHNKDLLTFQTLKKGSDEIRDFQTTGVVSFARGTPFYRLKPGKLVVQGKRVAVDAAQIKTRQDEIHGLAIQMH